MSVKYYLPNDFEQVIRIVDQKTKIVLQEKPYHVGKNEFEYTIHRNELVLNQDQADRLDLDLTLFYIQSLTPDSELDDLNLTKSQLQEIRNKIRYFYEILYGTDDNYLQKTMILSQDLKGNKLSVNDLTPVRKKMPWQK